MIGRPFRMEWHEEDTPAALKEAYLSQEDVSIRTRLHVLWLLRRGWRITAAAEAVGVHYRSAQRWVEWYREGGLNEVVSRKMGGVGQPRYLNLDGKPMAWCSVAPQRSYRELGGSRYPLDASENVWSIACFFTARRLRGQGITRRLIGAAVDYAARNGATVVEAYPVEPDSPSYKFMGLVSSFEALGFQEVGKAGTRRRVIRLSL